MGKVNKRPERLMLLKLIAVFKLFLETDWLSQIKEIQDLKITLCITSWGFFSSLVSMGYQSKNGCCMHCIVMSSLTGLFSEKLQHIGGTFQYEHLQQGHWR